MPNVSRRNGAKTIQPTSTTNTFSGRIIMPRIIRGASVWRRPCIICCMICIHLIIDCCTICLVRRNVMVFGRIPVGRLSIWQTKRWGNEHEHNIICCMICMHLIFDGCTICWVRRNGMVLGMIPVWMPPWRGSSPVQRSFEPGDKPVSVSNLFTVAMDAGPSVFKNR